LSTHASFDTARRNPEHPRRGDGIDGPPLPPGGLVAEVVDVAVMSPAQGDGEFVADLPPHGAGLGELQVVGISGASCADQARLRSDEFEVGLVAQPTRFADRKNALVDLARNGVVLMFVEAGASLPSRGRRGRALSLGQKKSQLDNAKVNEMA
jgi:hypothetical protein